MGGKSRERRGITRFLVLKAGEHGVAGGLVVRPQVVAEQVAGTPGGEGKLEVVVRGRGPLQPAADGHRHGAVGRHGLVDAHALEGGEPFERGERELRLHLIDRRRRAGLGVSFGEGGDSFPKPAHEPGGQFATVAVAVTGLADCLQHLASGVIHGKGV